MAMQKGPRGPWAGLVLSAPGKDTGGDDPILEAEARFSGAPSLSGALRALGGGDPRLFGALARCGGE
jgi:hypothetical protein